MPLGCLIRIPFPALFGAFSERFSQEASPKNRTHFFLQRFRLARSPRTEKPRRVDPSLSTGTCKKGCKNADHFPDQIRILFFHRGTYPQIIFRCVIRCETRNRPGRAADNSHVITAPTLADTPQALRELHGPTAVDSCAELRAALAHWQKLEPAAEPPPGCPPSTSPTRPARSSRRAEARWAQGKPKRSLKASAAPLARLGSPPQPWARSAS